MIGTPGAARRRAGALVAVLVLSATPTWGGQSRQRVNGVVGGDIHISKTSAGDPAAAVSGVVSGVVWIGYDTSMRPQAGRICCYHSAQGDMCCAGCLLQDGRWFRNESDGVENEPAAARLESESILRVFVRLQDGQVTQVRTYSGDCPIDARGAQATWLGTVTAARSLEFLTGLVSIASGPGEAARADIPPGVWRGALAAISFHAGSASLERLLAWGRHAPSSELRRQSLFWLAQRAGTRAVATIENAVRNDPDEAVKRQAVFALGQLPPDRGIPLLIHVARTSPIASVRRQAVFWLGQMQDPRAFEFIEKLLRAH